MIVCSLCKETFSSLADLTNHLYHSNSGNHPVLTSNDPIQCCYESCFRLHRNKRSFLNHFFLNHAEDVLKVSSIPRIIEGVSSGLPETNSISPPDDPDENLLAVEFKNYEENHSQFLSKTEQVVTNPEVMISGSEPVVTNPKAIIESKVVEFCASLNSSLSLPSSHVQLTFQSTASLIHRINYAYEQKLLSLCSEVNDLTSENLMTSMKDVFTFVNNTLDQFKSTYLQQSYFEKHGFFFPPKTHILGYVQKRRRFRGKSSILRVKKTVIMIPLRQVLKNFLSQENILSNILQYIETLKNEKTVMENIVQSNCWKDVFSSDYETVLPLSVFNDDVELDNPLGGHAGTNKINATYVSIPCLLPEMRSALCNIFVAQLTKTSNFKLFGISAVFKPLVKELNFLARSGIVIKNSDGRNKRIFFRFCALLGDNLGLNTVGGFTQNFSTVDFCCRFCLADRNDRKMLTIELPNLLRTEENYEKQVEENNMRTSGIKEECVFNSVDGFHIIKNCAVDTMHDLFEGVVHYDLAFILKYFIFDKRLFTLSDFNTRMSDFNFGVDTSNKPPSISENFKKKFNLKMSASECVCLLKYFGFLVGSFISLNDPVWELFIALRRVVDIVMSPSVDKRVTNLLSDYIQSHHYLYMNLTQKGLTQKFHNLIHYPRLIEHFGPLVHLSTMRYESKHRELKKVANTVASRRDICLTIAKKCQLHLNSSLLSSKDSSSNVIWGTNENRSSSCLLFEQLNDHVFTTSIPSFLRHKSTIHTSWVKISGTKYSKGVTLYVDMDKETSFPMFGSLQKIFVTENQTVYFLLKNCQTLSFHEQFYAYEIRLRNSFSIYKSNEIHDYHPHHAVSDSNNNLFVSLLHNH